jgi:hypothetical protein
MSDQTRPFNLSLQDLLLMMSFEAQKVSGGINIHLQGGPPPDPAKLQEMLDKMQSINDLLKESLVSGDPSSGVIGEPAPVVMN